MRQRVDVMAFCSRKGYCKDGYCTYRAGDLTPRVDTRPEVFALTSVTTPASPCVDGCCPGNASCSQNATLLAVRTPGRYYRADEVLIAPRECVRLVLGLSLAAKLSQTNVCDRVVGVSNRGDPRLGVNQAYDRMPYSIPLANLP